MRTRSYRPARHAKRHKPSSFQSSKFSKGRASECRRIDPETGEVVEVLIRASQSKAKVVVSPAEIEAGRSPAGGWSRATLARWGVSWPPRRGWKRKLIEEYEKATGKSGSRLVHSAGSKDMADTTPARHLSQSVSASPGYLVRMQKDPVTERLFIGSQVAHLWDGADTSCRMWSTSEMSRETTRREFIVYDVNPGLRICEMCQSNADKPEHRRMVTWGDSWQE